MFAIARLLIEGVEPTKVVRDPMPPDMVALIVPSGLIMTFDPCFTPPRVVSVAGNKLTIPVVVMESPVSGAPKPVPAVIEVTVPEPVPVTLNVPSRVIFNPDPTFTPPRTLFVAGKRLIVPVFVITSPVLGAPRPIPVVMEVTLPLPPVTLTIPLFTDNPEPTIIPPKLEVVAGSTFNMPDVVIVSPGPGAPSPAPAVIAVTDP